MEIIQTIGTVLFALSALGFLTFAVLEKPLGRDQRIHAGREVEPAFGISVAVRLLRACLAKLKVAAAGDRRLGGYVAAPPPGRTSIRPPDQSVGGGSSDRLRRFRNRKGWSPTGLRSMTLAAMLVTTTNNVEGRRIAEYLGVVAGEAILGANIFRDIFASIRDIVGGRSGAYEKALGDARRIALAEMADKAAELGATAIVGVDIDYETVGSNGSMLMVTAAGTAVKLE